MPLDLHARDPDDDDDNEQDRSSGNEWTPQGDNDNGIELTAHEAAFMPPGSGSGSRSGRTALRSVPRHFPANELAVLRQVRTVINAEGTEVLAPEFLGQILGNCITVQRGARCMAQAVAYRAKPGKNEAPARSALAEDLLQEAVLRWLDGSWNYPKADFDKDMSSSDPVGYVAARFCGSWSRSRIRGLWVDECKRSKTRAETEASFVQTYCGVHPGQTVGVDDGEVPDVPAPESVTLDKIYQLMPAPQVMALIQQLVEITAECGGFGKYSASAAEVFRLLRSERGLPPQEVANRCGVPDDFAYKMNRTDEECYVVRQIRRFASGSEAYRQLMALCPDELYEHFRGRAIEWFVINLDDALDQLGRRAPDTRGEDALDD